MLFLILGVISTHVAYLSLSSFLQYAFYSKKDSYATRNTWKIQPQNDTHRLGMIHWFWPIVHPRGKRGREVLSMKRKDEMQRDKQDDIQGENNDKQGNQGTTGGYRGGVAAAGKERITETPPRYALYTMVNLMQASLFAGVAGELMWREKSSISWTRSMFWIPVDLVWACAYQSLIEYVWHLLMHQPFFYQHFHKIHHYFKSPNVFDDLYVHPVEVFGYYCILWSPVIVLPIHGIAFLIYLIIHYVCGILDHSGVDINLGFLYNTVDHDMHHKLYDVNYGFPNCWLDYLFNTHHSQRKLKT